jgi:hypothetical protein
MPGAAIPVHKRKCFGSTFIKSVPDSLQISSIKKSRLSNKCVLGSEVMKRWNEGTEMVKVVLNFCLEEKV